MSSQREVPGTLVKEAEPTVTSDQQAIQETVSEIIEDVTSQGDPAIKQFTREFDNVTRETPKLTPEEIDEAIGSVSQEDRETIDQVIENVRTFHEAQMDTLNEFETEVSPGVVLGQRFVPLERIGAYVPGGRHPLIASVAMSIVPAAVANVETIVACSPPHTEYGGCPHPLQVYAMQKAGADEIYAIGGAQAIAAMAQGTDTIAPVDKITGPGNVFVVEAKRQLYGNIGIDLLAGPSEILIIADETADIDQVALDLLAQAEHDTKARPILVTTDETTASDVQAEIESLLPELKTEETVRQAWEQRGEILLVGTLSDATVAANSYAPEHLHIMTENPRSLVDDLEHYGSLFLGENSPVVFSDKAVGTNHILPTQQAARYTGGLWVGTYLKPLTHQQLTENGAGNISSLAQKVCKLEGMHGHELSARNRDSTS